MKKFSRRKTTIIESFSDFTTSSGSREKYAATNPWMKFAIDFLDDEFTGNLDKNHMNALFPGELKALKFKSIERFVQSYIGDYLFGQTSSGLVISLKEKPNQGLGVLSQPFESRLTDIKRMADFLEWYPEDFENVVEDEDPRSASLHRRCVEWADRLMATNVPASNSLRRTNNGHLLPGGDNTWKLYASIHAGPPHEHTWNDQWIDERGGASVVSKLQGLPDGLLVWTQSYGGLALAFERLSQDVGDDQYKAFARRCNQGLWKQRLDRSRYLAPKSFLASGAIWPEERGGVKKQIADGHVVPHGGLMYQYDTDSFYWCRFLYRSYQIADGTPRPDLRPRYSILDRLWDFLDSLFGVDPASRRQRRISRQAQARKRLLESELDDEASDPAPELYLKIALGMTLEWIEHGWSERFKQFRRKVIVGGQYKDTYANIYGDGTWNTLFVLVEAYRATGDDFYLSIFADAWNALIDAARRNPDVIILSRSHTNGVGSENNVSDNHTLIQVMVDAYHASVERGSPRPDFLANAVSVANTFKEVFNRGIEGEKRKINTRGDQHLAIQMMRLAIAEGVLRRVQFEGVPAPGLTVTFNPSSAESVVVELPPDSAVTLIVYMNDGDYTMVYEGSASGTTSFTISSDASIDFQTGDVLS